MDPKPTRFRAEGGAARTERVRGAIFPVSCFIKSGSATIKNVSFTYSDSFFFTRDLDVIEQALARGETVLIENLPEKVDPVLEPLLGRNTIKRGRLVLKLQHYIYIVITKIKDSKTYMKH